MVESTLVVCHTDETVFHSVQMFEAIRDYEAMLQLLHDDPSIVVTQATLSNLLRSKGELLVFVENSGQLVATAQGSLCRTEPLWQVLVNNVVVHDDHQGMGHGRRIMTTLEQAVRVRWGENGLRSIKLLLTNSPQKENAGFYRSVGWTARTQENNNPTVCWIKEI